jgi:putative heme-binding domain-containing protein
MDAKYAIPPLSGILLNDKEPIAVREQIASALAGTNHGDAHSALVQGLQNAPARLQTTIALGMAGSAQGGDRLLKAIEAGKASPRLLHDRAIEVRLSSAKITNVKDRLKKLTQGLPATDDKAQALIAKQRDAFVSFKADPVMGEKVFQKSCAICHQIATQGAKIGPQLDGIGVRGIERLLEDVLDPNRNVDQAFRTTQIVTKEGKSITGLFLREEGNIVILGNNEGKEVRVDKSTIDERIQIPLSPMPSNFTETIGEADFHHLMAYLLTQRGKS